MLRFINKDFKQPMITKKRQYMFGAVLVMALLAAVIFNVSAATFDSDIVPNSNGDYRLGNSPGDWSSINDTIFFTTDSKVGISDSAFTPDTRLHVVGTVKVEHGDVYISSNANGVILTAPDSSCWMVTVDNAGALTAVSVPTCP
jgi:hypothetical protein